MEVGDDIPGKKKKKKNRENYFEKKTSSSPSFSYSISTTHLIPSTSVSTLKTPSSPLPNIPQTPISPSLFNRPIQLVPAYLTPFSSPLRFATAIMTGFGFSDSFLGVVVAVGLGVVEAAISMSVASATSPSSL